MPELIFDDYVTLDDGRRSAVGHHHDSGRDDNAASRPSQPTPPARTTIERYWRAAGAFFDSPATTNRVKAIRAGSPLTDADAPLILAVIRRAGLEGITDYELRRWFQYLSLPGIAWHDPYTVPDEQLQPILADLVADRSIFRLTSTQTPYDAAPPRRPITCQRYYASDYPEFRTTDTDY